MDAVLKPRFAFFTEVLGLPQVRVPTCRVCRVCSLTTGHAGLQLQSGGCSSAGLAMPKLANLLPIGAHWFMPSSLLTPYGRMSLRSTTLPPAS